MKASSVRGPPPGTRTVTAQSPPSAAIRAAQLLGGQRIRDVDHADGAARKAADRDRAAGRRGEAQEIGVGPVRVRVMEPDDVDQADTSSPRSVTVTVLAPSVSVPGGISKLSTPSTAPSKRSSPTSVPLTATATT